MNVCSVLADPELSSFVILKNPKTFGACHRTQHIVALVRVFTPCNRVPPHFRLSPVNRANLVALAILTYSSVNGI